MKELIIGYLNDIQERHDLTEMKKGQKGKNWALSY